MNQSVETGESTLLRRRYLDAYRVAKVIVWVGTVVKTVGKVCGLVAFLVGAIGAQHQTDAIIVQLIAGLLFGGMVFLFFFVIGVFISAQGEILKATLDTAVNSSPFLNNESRAEIMSLR